MNNTDNNRPSGIQIWTPLFLGLAVVAGMFLGMRMNNSAPSIQRMTAIDTPSSAVGQGRVEEIIRYIEAKYVDGVDTDEMVNEAIQSLISDLDPHSNYIPAKELKEINEQLEGSFDGIGIEYMILDDTIVVVTPLSGGPSEAAGIQVGDKVLTIEDSLVAGVNIDNFGIMTQLRGEAGTDVKVTIKRNNESEPVAYTITRAKIPNSSVDVSYMLEDDIGYIKVNRFSAQTYEEFMAGIEKLAGEGMKNIVIDLRHNPGGYLQEATQMLSQLFKEKGMLLVYTEGDHVSRSDYDTTGRPFFDIDQIAVLIDEGSASASEIVAGAIQDHDRGWIIGRRSFGKGLVQEQYTLKDGSALRLTVARYYTPSGRSIQKDYGDREGYDSDVFNRYETGELLSADSISMADSLEYFTDLGRKVYGGGGIVPEIFVPLDTITMDSDYIRLRQFVPQFVFRYKDANATTFAEQDFEIFNDSFRQDGNVWNEFLEYAAERGEEYMEQNKKDYQVTRELQRFMKARLAKLLYGDTEMYSVLNEGDDMVKEALEVLRARKPVVEGMYD